MALIDAGMNKNKFGLYHTYFYNTEDTMVIPYPERQMGVDEAGRGCLFGRVYSAAVIIPYKSPDFNYDLLRDSKRFTAKKKNTIYDAADYIKNHAIAWGIGYAESEEIDHLNIRVASYLAMHRAIYACMKMLEQRTCEMGHDDDDDVSPMSRDPGELASHEEYGMTITNPKTIHKGWDIMNDIYLLIDGNDFIPIRAMDHDGMITTMKWQCIERGDNSFAAIAAASILAKTARDTYVRDMCKRFRELSVFYEMDKHMGYATTKHRAAIQQYGATTFHRKTFGICKLAEIRELDEEDV